MLTHEHRVLAVLLGLAFPAMVGLSCSLPKQSVPTQLQLPRPGAATPNEFRSRGEKLLVGGAALRVTFDGASPAQRKTLLPWVQRSASLVADYCGGTFPVPKLAVDVNVRSGSRVRGGHHWGGVRVRASVGGRATAATLRRDVVLVHEMLHVAFPRLPRQQRWMREGLSTYLEVMVLGQAGILREQEVWSRWRRSMPQGLPREGEHGLDHSRTWASVYWGGALYWMRVDIELRRQSDNQQSLQTLVEGVLRAGGNGKVLWPVARVVQTADDATGLTVMSDLYQSMAAESRPFDLEALFADFGVIETDDGVTLSDDAPLADLRKALTAKSAH